MSNGKRNILIVNGIVLLGLLILIYLSFKVPTLLSNEELLIRVHTLKATGYFVNISPFIIILMFGVNIFLFKKYEMKQWLLLPLLIFIIYVIIISILFFIFFKLFSL